jgi:hypothetical protein
MESLAIYYDLAKAHALPHSTCSDVEYTIYFCFFHWSLRGHGFHRMGRHRITQAQILA